LKSLQQSVIAAAAQTAHQITERSRLDAAEDRKAGTLDVQRAATDAVIRVGAVSIPALKIERSVGFVALPVERAKESRQLIAEVQHSEWILLQDFPELFDGCVVDDIAFADRLVRIGAQRMVGALAVFHSPVRFQQFADVVPCHPL